MAHHLAPAGRWFDSYWWGLFLWTNLDSPQTSVSLEDTGLEEGWTTFCTVGQSTQPQSKNLLVTKKCRTVVSHQATNWVGATTPTLDGALVECLSVLRKPFEKNCDSQPEKLKFMRLAIVAGSLGSMSLCFPDAHIKWCGTLAKWLLSCFEVKFSVLPWCITSCTMTTTAQPTWPSKVSVATRFINLRFTAQPCLVVLQWNSCGPWKHQLWMIPHITGGCDVLCKTPAWLVICKGHTSMTIQLAGHQGIHTPQWSARWLVRNK